MEYYGKPPYRAMCNSDGEVRYYVSDYIPNTDSQEWKRAYNDIILDQKNKMAMKKLIID